jgi:putative spermidine/putrescine transport system ATP-binding protein
MLGNEQFILKIPNSSSNLDIKLGNEINVGWNAIDSRALDPK